MEDKTIQGIIDWLPTIPNEYPKNSKQYNIGIKIKGSFYNQHDTLNKLTALLTRIKVGYEIKIIVDGDKIKSLEVINDKVAASAKKNVPGSLADKLEKVNYKTLMAEAHKIGIQSTKVELVPELTNMAEKKACFKATVVIARKSVNKQAEEIQYQTFEDYGEACGSDNEEANIDSKQIRPAYIRMASTRALVRALRQATNNMETAEEEMPDGKLPSDK